MDRKVVDWLMAGDHAIRWQVQRDLLELPERTWKKERARVAKEGWGARLLSHQDAAGRWTPRIYGHKWISTTYSMLLLRAFGLPEGHPGALKACRILLDEGQMPDGGISVAVTEPGSETCVSGMVLGLVAWFGLDDPRRDKLAAYLLRDQREDGGWNCLHGDGVTHASFHTPINVLEGLRDAVAAGLPKQRAMAKAEAKGREFFLAHRLYKSHRTGRVVDPVFTRFAFPPRWHHDVLRALDHFQAAGAPYDGRLDDAVALVRGRRTKDGRWLLGHVFPGKTFFEMERRGEPSRWNTLRALRVLKWYDRVAA